MTQSASNQDDAGAHLIPIERTRYDASTARLLNAITVFVSGAQDLMWQLEHRPESSLDEWSERVSREIRGAVHLVEQVTKGKVDHRYAEALPGSIELLKRNLVILENFMATTKTEKGTNTLENNYALELLKLIAAVHMASPSV